MKLISIILISLITCATLYETVSKFSTFAQDNIVTLEEDLQREAGKSDPEDTTDGIEDFLDNFYFFDCFLSISKQNIDCSYAEVQFPITDCDYNGEIYSPPELI